jgi:hypothetical protein
MPGGSLGSLVVDISANVAKFTTDMNNVSRVAEENARRIDQVFSTIGKTSGILALVAATVEAFDTLKEAATGAIEAAAALERMSQVTGSTVEGLANLAATARLSNTGTDELQLGLVKLSKSMIDASNGGLKTSAAFQAIGISTQGIAQQRPDEVFRQIAQRLALYQDGAEKTAVAQALLGKSGASLLPLLHDLADGGEIQSRVTAEQAKQAEEFEKNLARLKVTFTENSNAIVQSFLPALSQMSEQMLAAQKNGAGLLQTLISIPLGNLAAAITNTPIQERIDNDRAAIKRLQDQIENPSIKTPEFIAGLRRQITAAKADLEGLLAKQREAALQGAGDTSGLTDQVTRGRQQAPKPVIQLVDFAALAAKAKAERDAALKDLDRFISSEDATLSQREQFLSRYYNQDEISLVDYFAKRRGAIEDNLATVSKAYEQEIAAAAKFAATPGLKDAEKTAALEKEAELRDKLSKVQSAASLALINNGLDEAQAALQQREAIETLNIELLKMTGHLEEAAALQQKLSLEQLPRRRLGPEGDAQAADVIARQRIADDISAKQKAITDLEAQEGVIEQRIALQEQVGSVSSLEALRRLGDARQAEIGQLETLVVKYDELAAKSGTPEAILAAEQLHLKLEQLKADADPLSAKFEAMFETAFTDNFAKVIDGTESIRKAFSNMVNSIEQELSKIAAQDIAKQLFGPQGGASGGGIGSFISSLFGSGGTRLAPGQAGPPANAAGSGTGFFASIAALLPAFADGGDTTGSGAYLVGERGPEIFTPGRSGRVSPITQGHTININLGSGASVTRDSAAMIGATVARHLSALHARNN